MARQLNQYYVGRQGNVIFYKLNEGYYLRSMPVAFKQTTATKIRSTNFAIASRAGRTLRYLLEPVIPFSKDKRMQNHFAGAIMKWLKLNTMQQIEPAANLPFIQNFQFNSACSLSCRWKTGWQVTPVNDGMLSVYIPAFIPLQNISAPASTVSIECTITVASCTLENGEENGSFTKSFSIPYTDDEIPGQVQSFPLAMPAGSLVVAAVALQYNVIKNGIIKPTANAAFMPSGVIKALYV
jgi:hypothetical protein